MYKPLTLHSMATKTTTKINMLSSSPLSFPSYTPQNQTSRTTHRRPASRTPILNPNFRSKRKLESRIWRTGVSGHKNMTESVRFARANDGEDDRVEEGSSNGSPAIGGFATTLNGMSKWLIVASYISFILWRHDVEASWFTMGSVINSGLSITLKRVLNHRRPVSAHRFDPGMPSCHAQNIFYIASYVIISLFDWVGMNIFSMTVGAIIVTCCFYLSWLRVSQHFHTAGQVIVGVVLGSACGATWFRMWHPFVHAAFGTSVRVRIVVALGSVSFCMAFSRYLVHHLPRGRRSTGRTRSISVKSLQIITGVQYQRYVSQD